jgi:hypothetical protein
MHPENKKEVVDYLMAQPAPSRLKRQLLLGWAITVGVRLSGRDYAAVERTGTDR